MLSKFRIYRIAIEFYKACKKLDLPPGAKDQLLRAARSIGNNSAEGYCRFLSRDKRRFYRIAYGSVKECLSVFDQEEVRDADLLDMADHLGAGLYKLIR